MNTEPIKTRVGQAGWTDHRHFGMSVFNELAGTTTTTGLIALAATGRKMGEEDCRMLDDIAVILTVADPRIYPLKLVRLASAYGDPLAGMAAAVAAMQGALVGPRIAQDTAHWLKQLKEETNQTTEGILKGFQKLLKQGRLSGFGVPFRQEDERAVALKQRATKRNRHTGTYWKLQETVSDYLKETKGIPANVGLPIAALSLDMGLNPDTLAALYTGLTINVFLANAVEGAEQAPEQLRCLPESTVEYIGRGERESGGRRSGGVC